MQLRPGSLLTVVDLAGGLVCFPLCVVSVWQHCDPPRSPRYQR